MGSHLVEVDGKLTFKSDKYPECPAGKVPLSVKDTLAQPVLWRYAQRFREQKKDNDPEFADDVETALKNAGFVPSDREKMTIEDRLISMEAEYLQSRGWKCAILDGNSMTWYRWAGSAISQIDALLIQKTADSFPGVKK
jgi:hypothetical protein